MEGIIRKYKGDIVTAVFSHDHTIAYAWNIATLAAFVPVTRATKSILDTILQWSRCLLRKEVCAARVERMTSRTSTTPSTG